MTIVCFSIENDSKVSGWGFHQTIEKQNLF